MGKRSRQIIRAVSFALVVCFLAQDVLWANPEAASLFPPVSQKFSLPSISSSVAILGDMNQAHSTKTLYLIQDAHTNPSAQKNISKALQVLLKEEKIKHVFVEAGTGDDSLSSLRGQASAKRREEAGAYFLNEGLIGGEEYLDLTSEQDFKLWGVEDKALYWQSINLYRRIVQKRSGFEDYLQRFDRALKVLAPRILSPALNAFNQKKILYRDGALTQVQYFDVLKGQADRLGTNLLYYPHLQSLHRIKLMEEALDFDKASREQKEALKLFSEKDLNEVATASQTIFRWGSQEDVKEKAFFALLEEKLDTKLGARRKELFPALSQYFDYLREIRALDPRAIVREETDLERVIEKSLAVSRDETLFLKCQEALLYWKRLLELSLTPEDEARFRQESTGFDLERLSGFLNKKIMDLGNHYSEAVFLKEGFGEIVALAEQFYALTLRRDKVFVHRALEKMDETGDAKAVLITGGYHTPNLTRLLKDQNISFVVVTPQVLQETNLPRYEKLLLGQLALKSSASRFVGSADQMDLMPAVERGLVPVIESRMGEISGARLAEPAKMPAQGELIKPSNQQIELTQEEVSQLTPQFKGFMEFFSSIGSLKSWKALYPNSKLVVMARHGETAGNVLGFTGSHTIYTPLTPRGIRQGNALKQFMSKLEIDFDWYGSSDLERAYRTMRPLADEYKKELHLLPIMREVHVYPLGGLRKESKIQGSLDMFWDRFWEDPEKYERPGFSTKKTRDGLQQLFFEEIPQSKDGTFLIGTHAGAIQWSLAQVFNISMRKFKAMEKVLGQVPSNLGLTILSYDDATKEWKLLVYNDNSYLPESLRGRTTGFYEKFMIRARYYAGAITRIIAKPFGFSSLESLSDSYPSRESFLQPSKERLREIAKPFLPRARLADQSADVSPNEVEQRVRQLLNHYPNISEKELETSLRGVKREDFLKALESHLVVRMVPDKVGTFSELSYEDAGKVDWKPVDVEGFKEKSWFNEMVNQPWFADRLRYLEAHGNELRDLIHPVISEKIGTSKYALAIYGTFLFQEKSKGRDLDLIAVSYDPKNSLQIFGSQEIHVPGLSRLFPWLAGDYMDLNVINIEALQNSRSETAMSMLSTLSGSLFITGSPSYHQSNYMRLMHVVFMWTRQNWTFMREPKAFAPPKMRHRVAEVRGILRKILRDAGLQLNPIDQAVLNSGDVFKAGEYETVEEYYTRMSALIGNYVDEIEGAMKRDIRRRVLEKSLGIAPSEGKELKVAHTTPGFCQNCGISKYSMALNENLHNTPGIKLDNIQVFEEESTKDPEHLAKQLQRAVDLHPDILHLHYADGFLRKNKSEGFIEFTETHADILRKANAVVATIYELGPRMLSANRLPQNILKDTAHPERAKMMQQLRTEMKRLLNAVDGIIVHSEEQLRYIKQDTEFDEIVNRRGVVVEVMRHGIPKPQAGYDDPKTYAAWRKEVRDRYQIKDDQVALIQMGFIRSNKEGMDILQLLKNDERLVWLLAGGPRQASHAPYRDELLERAKSMGVSDRVIATGWVPDEDMSKMYAAGDIAIVPYKTGSESYVLASGLGHGLPVVASALPFILDARRRYGDVVYRAANDEEFAREIKYLADHKEYREALGKQAAIALELDSWEEIAKRTKAFYEKVLNAKSTRGARLADEMSPGEFFDRAFKYAGPIKNLRKLSPQDRIPVLIVRLKSIQRMMEALGSEPEDLWNEDYTPATQEIMSAFLEIGQPAILALKELMSDENVRTRTRAAIILEELGVPIEDPEVLFELRRWSAVKGLGALAIPAMIKKLDEKSLYNTAEVALSILKDIQSEDEFKKLLISQINKKNQFVLDLAVRYLAEIDPAAHRHVADSKHEEEISVMMEISKLIEKLEDKDEKVRARAAEVLGQKGPVAKAAVPVLSKALEDEDVNVRSNAARSLGQIGSAAKAAIPALIAALKDKEWRVRFNAAPALGLIGPATEGGVSALMTALGDEWDDVRLNAAWALGHIGSAAKASTPALIKALGDNNERVRSYVVEALGQIGPDASAAVPALITALGDEDRRVRRDAAQSLRLLGPDAKAAVPALIMVLRDKEHEVCFYATQTLGHIGMPAIPALIEALEDQNARVRLSAVEALRQIGPKAYIAIPALIKALKDKDERVRFSVPQTLGQIGMPAIPALIEALRDGDGGVQYSAASALGKMGPGAKAAIPALTEVSKGSDKSFIGLAAADALHKIDPTKGTRGARLADLRSTHTRFGADNAAEEISFSVQKDGEYGIQLWRPDNHWYGTLPAMINNNVSYSIYADRNPNLNFGIHRYAGAYYGRVDLRFDDYGNFEGVAEWKIESKGAARYPWLKDSLNPWFESQKGKPLNKRNASLADSEPLVDGSIEDQIERALSENNFKEDGLPVIQQIGVVESLRILLPILTDRNRHKTFRTNAVVAVGEFGGDALLAFPILQNLMWDPEFSKEARAAIEKILRKPSGARLADKQIAAAIEKIRTVLSGINPDDSRVAEQRYSLQNVLNAIARRDYRTAGDILKDLEKDFENNRLLYGVEGIKAARKLLNGQSGARLAEQHPGESTDQYVNRVIEALGSKDKGFRMGAITSVIHLGPDAKNAIPALIRLYKDLGSPRDPQLYSGTLAALTVIGPKRDGSMAISAAIDILRARDPIDEENEKFALDFLHYIGNRSIPALVELVKSGDSRAKTLAAHTLTKIGPASVPALIELLKEDDSTVKERVVQALSKIGYPAISALTEASTSDSLVNQSAKTALNKIRGARLASLANIQWPEVTFRLEKDMDLNSVLQTLRGVEGIIFKEVRLGETLIPVAATRAVSYRILPKGVDISVSFTWKKDTAAFLRNATRIPGLKPIDLILGLTTRETGPVGDIRPSLLSDLGNPNFLTFEDIRRGDQVIDPHKVAPEGQAFVAFFSFSNTNGARLASSLGELAQSDKDRVVSLKAEILEITKASGIEEFQLVANGTSFNYNSYVPILEAIQTSKVIALDLSPLLEIADETQRYKALHDRFYDVSHALCQNLKYSERQAAHVAIMEMLRNALLHGNAGDLSLPIFVHFDLKNKSIYFFDTAITQGLNARPELGPEERKALEVYLGGDKRSILEIKNVFAYYRESVRGASGSIVGKHVVISHYERPFASAEKALDFWQNIQDMWSIDLLSDEFTFILPAKESHEQSQFINVVYRSHENEKKMGPGWYSMTVEHSKSAAHPRRKVQPLVYFLHFEKVGPEMRIDRIENANHLPVPISSYLALREEVLNIFEPGHGPRIQKVPSDPDAETAALIKVLTNSVSADTLNKVPDFLASMGVLALPSLLKALRQGDVALQIRVARVLGRIGPITEEVVPALIEALKSKDQSVAEAAANALGQIGPRAKAAVPTLREIVGDPDRFGPFKGATIALGLIGDEDPRTIHLLIESFRIGYFNDEYILESLAKLAQLGSGENVKLLAEALKEENPRIQDGVARALIVVGAPAVPYLTEVLKSEGASDEVKVAAGQAIDLIKQKAEGARLASSLPGLDYHKLARMLGRDPKELSPDLKTKISQLFTFSSQEVEYFLIHISKLRVDGRISVDRMRDLLVYLPQPKTVPPAFENRNVIVGLLKWDRAVLTNDLEKIEFGEKVLSSMDAIGDQLTVDSLRKVLTPSGFTVTKPGLGNDKVQIDLSGKEVSADLNKESVKQVLVSLIIETFDARLPNFSTENYGSDKWVELAEELIEKPMDAQSEARLLLVLRDDGTPFSTQFKILGAKTWEEAIYREFGIWVIHEPGSSERERRFTEEDLRTIHKTLSIVPAAHLKSRVAKMIIKTPDMLGSEEARLDRERKEVLDLMNKLSDRRPDDAPAKVYPNPLWLLTPYIKTTAHPGWYETETRTVYVARVYDQEKLQALLLHEIGHGVQDHYLGQGRRDQFSHLHDLSIRGLNEAHSSSIEEGKLAITWYFAYAYGATNVYEDFATIYEYFYGGKLNNRSDLMQQKAAIVTSGLSQEKLPWRRLGRWIKRAFYASGYLLNVVDFFRILFRREKDQRSAQMKLSETAIKSLMQDLKSQDPDVRLKAANQLSRASSVNKDVMPALIDALKDEHGPVRFTAVLALGSLGSEAKPAIGALMGVYGHDKDPKIRQAAGQAINKIDPQYRLGARLAKDSPLADYKFYYHVANYNEAMKAAERLAKELPEVAQNKMAIVKEEMDLLKSPDAASIFLKKIEEQIKIGDRQHADHFIAVIVRHLDYEKRSTLDRLYESIRQYNSQFEMWMVLKGPLFFEGWEKHRLQERQRWREQIQNQRQQQEQQQRQQLQQQEQQAAQQKLVNEKSALAIDETPSPNLGAKQRSERLLKILTTFEVADPKLDWSLGHYKTAELMRAVDVLSKDLNKYSSMITTVLRLIIDRKVKRIHAIKRENDRRHEKLLEYQRGYFKQMGKDLDIFEERKQRYSPYRPIPMDWNLANEFALKLPPHLKKLLTRGPSTDESDWTLEQLEQSHYYYPGFVASVDANTISAIKAVLPGDRRKRAVYYSAGNDIVTPILVLKDLTDHIVYVDQLGFDDFFYHIPNLRGALSELGIDVLKVDAKNDTVIVAIQGKRIKLEFKQSENKLYSQYSAQAGDGLVYLKSLAGVTHREMIYHHFKRNQDGVVAFFPQFIDEPDQLSLGENITFYRFVRGHIGYDMNPDYFPDFYGPENPLNDEGWLKMRFLEEQVLNPLPAVVTPRKAAPVTRVVIQPKKPIQTPMQDLKSQDRDSRLQAIYQLDKSGASVEDITRALTEALKDEYGPVRFAAVLALGSIGPKAKPAISALMGVYGYDKDLKIRQAAGQTINKIDPQYRLGARLAEKLADSVERIADRKDTEQKADLSAKRYSLTADLEPFFIGIAHAHSSKIDGARLSLDLKEDGSKPYIFSFTKEGESLIAQAEGISITLDRSKLKNGHLAKKTDDASFIQDLRTLTDTTNNKVISLLDASGIDTNIPVILSINLSFLDNPSSEFYLDYLIAELQALKKKDKNVFFILEGPEHLIAQANDKDSTLFLTQVPQDLKKAPIVNLTPSTKTLNKSLINIPVTLLQEGDIPAFKGLLRLATASGRISTKNIPQNYQDAYSTLAGLRLQTQDIKSILEGTADQKTIFKGSLKAITKVAINRAIQLFKTMIRMVGAAA